METKTKKKKLVRVEIDRRGWYRGQGEDNSALLKRNGAKCCLGFACLTLGLPESKIRNKKMPWEVRMDGELSGLRIFNSGMWLDSQFSQTAAEINDDADLSDKDREKQLRALAKANGFQFIFTN